VCRRTGGKREGREGRDESLTMISRGKDDVVHIGGSVRFLSSSFASERVNRVRDRICVREIAERRSARVSFAVSFTGCFQLGRFSRFSREKRVPWRLETSIETSDGLLMTPMFFSVIYSVICQRARTKRSGGDNVAVMRAIVNRSTILCMIIELTILPRATGDR